MLSTKFWGLVHSPFNKKEKNQSFGVGEKIKEERQYAKEKNSDAKA